MSDRADPAVARFLDALGVERRLSPRTRAAYADDLARLVAHLGGAPVAWNAVAPDRIRAFAAEQHRGGLAPVSVRRRLSAIRSFYRWLLRESEATRNPADGVRAPKVARRLPGVVDADAMGGFLDGLARADDPLAARDLAIFELMYSSGLRLSELCALRWSDLDAAQGLVRVLGKGEKTRVVPVGRRALEALAAHRRAEPAGNEEPVFRGRGGAPIAPRTVQARLAARAREQGLWQRMHPHLLRHSCASHVLESSGNLRAVQELLGHADIATTQVYTHLDFQHLAKVYDGAHPRARRKAGA